MDGLNTPPELLASLSAIVVVGPECPADDLFARLSDTMAAYALDTEIVIVANGVSDAVAMRLKSLIDLVPDTTVHFLANAIDPDVAVLLGMDNAIGDWVLLTTLSGDEVDALPSLLSAASQGFDVLIADSADLTVAGGPFYRNWRRLFVAFYNLLSGYDVEVAPSPLRLYSRPAAVHITRQRGGEMLIKSRTLSSGFPVKHILSAHGGDRRQPRRSWINSIGKAIRTVISSSAMPIRVVGMLGVLTGLIALLYSAYVVVIYFTQTGVQPGWTTLSLQLAGFMFLVSVMFVLLAEYIIQIHASASPRATYSVVRELRSPRSSRGARINVINETGAYLDAAATDRFELGAGRALETDAEDPS